MTAAGQIRHGFPAYRVFIYGIDVTEDVFGVTISVNTGRTPNTCSITLNNKKDKYIYTTDDLTTLYRNVIDTAVFFNKLQRNLTAEEFDANERAELLNQLEKKSEQSIIDNADSFSEVKGRVLRRKLSVRRRSDEPAVDVSGADADIAALRGNIYRYPLQAEDPIFHPNDPIRIFLRDPFNPSRWYHGFAGFVSDFDDTVDENNQSILTIGGEGPFKLLRYSRITFNPGIIDVDAITVAEIDAASRTFYTQGFNNLTLPEVMFASIFGNDPTGDLEGKFKVEREDAQKSASQAGRFRGVGNFNFSRSGIIEFGGNLNDGFTNPNPTIIKINTLKEYQSLIDHEVKETDLFEMKLEGSQPTADEETRINSLPRNDDNQLNPVDIIDIIGTDPVTYPVDGGRLILFIPSNFHPQVNRNILLKDLIDAPTMKTEMRSRLGMLFDIVDNIDFYFYESPKGDLICEFPLYDFDPDDWEFEETEHIAINSESEQIDVNNTGIRRGPFGSRWVVSKRDTYNFSRQITDEKIRTQVAGTWKLIQGYDQTGNADIITAPAVITLKNLIPLYGIRLEQADPKFFLGSKEAAYTHAHIMLNKANADARNLGINAAPNFGLWLNRPLFFIPRNNIGLITGYSHTINWGAQGTVDTRINLNYIRGWDGLVDTSRLDDNGKPIPVYTPIGGKPSRPLDYSVLFGISNPESGVNNANPADVSTGESTE